VKQEISALMDGELEADQARTVIGRLGSDSSLRSEWALYHLIGDALREQAFAAFDVEEQVRRRLTEEPTVLAPRRLPARSVRLYVLSAAASVAAVALVGWVVLQGQPEGERPAFTQPASVIAGGPWTHPALQAAPPPLGRLNDYLLVHQGHSPSTQIQGMATYVRAVSHPEAEARP
jgi:sigma-E factor negative regulatory protein RseA